jgi:SAM-dependent methyltransferase
MSAEIPEQVSFRDPDGHVLRIGDRVLRVLRRERAEECDRLLAAPWFAGLVDEGALPRTWRIDRPEGCEAWGDDWFWLEHEALPFPLYPHETTAAQLHDAARLTLHIARTALDNGWCLKDASAWNVLWDRGRPVFCDVASFAPDTGEPLWIAYGQFGRHFVIPLLLHRHLGLQTSSLFVTRRDGVTPRDARRMLGTLRTLRHRAAIEFVALASLAEGSGGAGPARSPKVAVDRDAGRSILHGTLRRLQRYIEGLDPTRLAADSTWSGYVDTRGHYTEQDLAQKSAFVETSLKHDPGGVLDLGCNTGEYSAMAARLGHRVVAADFDDQALMRLHRARAALAITAARFDIAFPTPAIGWDNGEVDSFLNRARGKFETVLCLGLVHHLLVSERVPLPSILALLRRLEPRRAVVEWIAPQDPMFVRIAGPNLRLYGSLDEAAFESALAPHWQVDDKLRLAGARRTLYRLLPR